MKEQTEEQWREQLLADEEVRSRVALRAYEIYQGRGGDHGGDLDDWLQAENEILAILIEQQPSGAAPELSGPAETGEAANQAEPPASETATAPKRKARG
jgi:hypothetical protein